MKPHRIRMAHNLLLNYGLYRKMEIYVGVVLLSVCLSVCLFVFTIFVCVRGRIELSQLRWFATIPRITLIS